MSLSTIDKNHMNNLLISMSFDQNNIEKIKFNYSTYSKLKLIAKQINHLKNEAYEIIHDHNIQEELLSLNIPFKLVSGNTYYLYQKSNLEKYLSLISPTEWNNKDIFLSKFYYDFDKQFIELEM